MFDHVLGQDDGQDAVWDSVQPLLTSVTHGYNICVFAYGQTGSGKTHTVLGSSEEHGIVQRTLFALMQWKAEVAPLADADVSPGKVNPGKAARAKLAARPMPVSSIPPHHTATPRSKHKS